MFAINTHQKKYLTLFFSVFIAISAIVLAYSLRIEDNVKNPKEAEAATFIPFGGPILYVDESSCCNGAIIHIQDAVTQMPIEVMYYYGISTLYSYYNLFTPGPNTVGQYFPVGICIEDDEECEGESTTDGWIDIVGTSDI